MYQNYVVYLYRGNGYLRSVVLDLAAEQLEFNENLIPSNITDSFYRSFNGHWPTKVFVEDGRVYICQSYYHGRYQKYQPGYTITVLGENKVLYYGKIRIPDAFSINDEDEIEG